MVDLDGITQLSHSVRRLKLPYMHGVLVVVELRELVVRLVEAVDMLQEHIHLHQVMHTES